MLFQDSSVFRVIYWKGKEGNQFGFSDAQPRSVILHRGSKSLLSWKNCFWVKPPPPYVSLSGKSCWQQSLYRFESQRALPGEKIHWTVQEWFSLPVRVVLKPKEKRGGWGRGALSHLLMQDNIIIAVSENKIPWKFKSVALLCHTLLPAILFEITNLKKVAELNPLFFFFFLSRASWTIFSPSHWSLTHLMSLKSSLNSFSQVFSPPTAFFEE